MVVLTIHGSNRIHPINEGLSGVKIPVQIMSLNANDDNAELLSLSICQSVEEKNGVSVRHFGDGRRISQYLFDAGHRDGGVNVSRHAHRKFSKAVDFQNTMGYAKNGG